MSLPLIEIFFSLILLLLWFFLVNLRERYLELNLKGWGEMSLGVFLIFLGSLLELLENIPQLNDYLSMGDVSWGHFSKIALYIMGIILVSFSPVNWLPSILEARSKFKSVSRRSFKVDSFLAELNKSAGKVETKESLNAVLDFALIYLCRELKTDSGAFFLLTEPGKELALTHPLNLSLASVQNLRKSEKYLQILTRSLRNKKVETAGEILNSDRKLAFAVKEDGLESCICIPLFSEDEPLGAVTLFSKIKYHFQKPDSENLLEIAEALGRRIQSLRVIENLERGEEDLKIAREKEKFVRLISEDLIEDNPEKVLFRIVKAGSEIFHPCDCKIYLRDGEFLFLKATSETGILEREVYLSESSWVRDAIQDKELKLVSGENYPELEEMSVRTAVALPLGTEGEPFGIIVFECKTKKDQFSNSELDFVRTLAFQTTEVLKKASLARALEHREALVSSLLDSIEDRVTIHDRKQRIVRINKAGLRFLNLSPEEILGKNCFEVLYNQKESEACPCYLSFREKKPLFQEIKLSRDKSGREGFLKVWTYPLLDDRGEVEMVVEYAKFEESLEAPSKLGGGKKEVPRAFFNDLNNILAGILGNAELIMLQVKPYKDLATRTMVADQINLIEELAIEGSKIIREAKGEVEELPEKRPVTEKELKVEKEKKVDKGLNILAIDDQKIIRDLLESILQSLGHNIKVASSGKDGLELFLRDGFDLVITDLGMPEMSGWEVSQRVKEIRKETPVVLITGWGVSFDSDKIKEYGVDYLLPKPFKVEQLSTLIEQIKEEKVKSRAGMSDSS